MNVFLDEIKNYCTEDAISNFKENYKSCFGIVSNLDIKNKNNKCFGKIVYLSNTNKFQLGNIVEFDIKRNKWKSSTTNGNKGFYIIDPKWCRIFQFEKKIKIPVYVRTKEGVVLEERELTFNQFKQQKLNYYYMINRIPAIAILAYKNFYSLYKPGKFYYALNSTVKYYYISEDKLKEILSTFNNQRKNIIFEWRKYLDNSPGNEIESLFEELNTDKEENNNDKIHVLYQ